jgi:lysophospholipase L1-like esterase
VPIWQSAIRDTAAAHGASVVELSRYADEIAAHPEYISADGFHPSTAGYARLAAIVAEAIGPTR